MFEISPVRLLFNFICEVGLGQGHFPVPFPSHLLVYMDLDVFSYSSMVAILALSVSVPRAVPTRPFLCRTYADSFLAVASARIPLFCVVIYRVIDSSGLDFLSRLVTFLCVVF